MSDPRPCLLIVEDDEGLQRQLRWAYDDYDVVTASDRKSAIDALRLHEPAVVTLDLGLPPDPDGTSEGFATLSEILALKPDTKVIIASGHGARESALRAIAGGAYDFYQKPVDIDALGLIVARAFHLHAIERENERLAQSGTTTKALGGPITAPARRERDGQGSACARHPRSQPPARRRFRCDQLRGDSGKPARGRAVRL